MEERKHILLVANTLPGTEAQLAQKGFDAMNLHGVQTTVSLLYVKPYFPTCYFHIPSMISLAEEFEREAKGILKNLGDTLGVPAENQWIATGRIRPETLKLAATLGVDFILASSEVHQELNQAFSFKKSRYSLPIMAIENLLPA